MTTATAHAFWAHRVCGETPHLPEYGVVGLLSASQQFDTVYLWQYETVNNVPEHVVIRDASELLPIEIRNELMGAKNMNVAHLSDIVRFLAAARHGGWVIDVDNWWLRPPPTGFCFSTLPVKRAGALAPRNALALDMRRRFQKGVWDGAGTINTPFSVVKNTPFASSLVELCRAVIQKAQRGYFVGKNTFGKSRWLVLMWGLRDLVLKHNMGNFVRPPIEYGPVPYWGGYPKHMVREDGVFNQTNVEKRTRFGTVIPHVDEIMEKSICVPTSFTFGTSTEVWKNLTPESMDIRAIAGTKPTSLLSYAYAHIMNEPSHSISGTVGSSALKTTQAQ